MDRKAPASFQFNPQRCCSLYGEHDACEEILSPPNDEKNSTSALQVDYNSAVHGSFNLAGAWEALGPGHCNDNGGVTHCKYGQSAGWHRWDIPTFGGGVAAARKACGEEASRMPNAIGAQYIHLWGWQFCMVMFPPGVGCPASVRGQGPVAPAPDSKGMSKGYYQEWIGTRGKGPITLGHAGNSGEHPFCFRKKRCSE